MKPQDMTSLRARVSQENACSRVVGMKSEHKLVSLSAVEPSLMHLHQAIRTL